MGPTEIKNFNRHLDRFFNPKSDVVKHAGTVINKHRQARKFLCKQLGITMKQLQKRRVLRDYTFRNDTYVYTGRL